MLKKCLLISTALLGSLTLTSCALGSLGAGYSIKAKTADGLTGEAEQRIVDRTKNEIYREINVCSSDRNN